jgi:hypothetical protein
MPKSDSNDSNRSWQLTGSSTSSDAKPSWMTRVGNLMRPNFGRNTPGRGGNSRITKLIFGTLLFVLVGQLLVTGLTILDGSYKLGLQQPVSKGLPWLTWFFLIYFVMLIGLWFLLNYFGFFPKPEPLPPSGSRGSSSSNGGGKSPAQIPGIGGPRVRVRSVAPAPAPTTAARTGFFSSFIGRRNASGATTTAPKESDHADAVARAYDETYQRVKAAQRLKRRREMR